MNFASMALQVLKGAVLAVVFCVSAVAVFAFVLSFTSPSDGAIRAINGCIKAAGIFLGCFFGLRGDKGWLKGGAVGVLTVMLTFLVFAMIGDPAAAFLVVLELLFGALVGALSGIVAVNVRRAT